MSIRWNGQGVIGTWLMLPLACCAQAQQANPAWFSQPQFFTYYDGYFHQTDPGLTQVPFTGQMFGVALPLNCNTDADLKQEVNAWHTKGGVYFFSADLLILEGTGGCIASPPADWDAFRMRNVNGAYLNLGGVYAVSNTPQYSLSSPAFQAALEAAAMRAVDLGADGLTFDDTTGQLQTMLQAPDGSGSFDTVTMGAFRTYLQRQYSAAVLLSQFGISDISSFDFGAYIRANSLTETWNRQPLTGLSREFYLFKRQESLNFLRNLSSSTKQYAQKMYGRNFLFNCNDNDSPGGYFITDAMDLEYAELPEIRGGDHPFAAVDVKAWKGWKSSITVKPTAMDSSWGPSAAPYLSGPTVNLERVLMADEEAAGGMAGATVQINEFLGNPEPVDLTVVNRYANFILDNPQLMTQTTTHAQTLLLQSAASLLGGTLASPAETNPFNGYTDYFGTGRLLLDSGITYDSIFLPDTSYSQLPPLALATLTPYKVVIAPYSWALDDNQLSVLLAYAQQGGGTLIIDGHFANSQPDGTPASRPNVQAILATPGVQPYGSGTIVVTNALHGLHYETTDMSAQRTVRAAFQSFIAPYASPDVTVTQPPAQIHEPGITPFFYRDRTGNALVHLVNYDYDDNTDQFCTKTNIQVQVQVGAQAVDDVILRSPDLTGAQALPFTRSGGTITVTVPEVDAWVVLYFQKSAFAPVIASASPSPAVGVVAGNSVSFSVQASDPGGNPLTYIWSVNGQLVTGVFGPAYSLQIPLTAGGLYTVAVTITDGARVAQTSWTINAATYHAPRVLFDESHEEENTLDPTRANQLNPQNPSIVLFGNLDQAMQAGYQVSRLAIGPITPQVLSGADVLVLAAPTQSLSGPEQQAIASFVQAGGGLVFLGVRNLNTNINTLIGQWGIQFDGTQIDSPQQPCCPQNFQLSSFANHPALGSNPSFQMNFGGSLTLSQGAIALGQTSAAEWKSISGQAAQQPGDPNGPFVIIAAAQSGKGRVFAISDNAFDDQVLQYTPDNLNPNLFLSALAWLSAAVNPTPSPPAPPPPAPVSAEPASGSGTSQTFTFAFSDANGYQSIGVADILFASALDGRHACYVAFVQATSSVLLVDDAGDAGGPYQGLVLPASGSIGNSQCTINGTNSSVSVSGNTLTLTLAIAFNAAFNGNKVIYTSAQDKLSNSSGWQALATWAVPGPPSTGPAVAGINPARGTSFGPALYTFTFSDTNGQADIAVANVLIASAIDGRHACYIAFVPATSSVLLVDDAGDAGGPYQGIVLPASGSISNGQCTIDGAGSSVSVSGNTLALTLAITFSQSFAGNRLFYLAARTDTATSDWQAVGSVTVP